MLIMWLKMAKFSLLMNLPVVFCQAAAIVMGLHQAFEAKENVEIEKETQTLAAITLQNYFRLYKKLGGMTGTAAD